MTDAKTALDAITAAAQADLDGLVTLDEIAATADVEYRIVPAWNGNVRIQSLSAGDLIEWSSASEGEAKRTAGLRLIVKSLVDKNGTRIANDKHIALFRLKSHKVTENIVREILRLNDLRTKAEEETKKD